MKIAICLFALVATATAAPLELNSPTDYTFDQYLADFSKSYYGSDYELRKELFTARVEAIASHNRNTDTWKLGVNQFTDMTAAEQKGYRSHNKGMSLTSTFPRANVATPAKHSLPAFVDWRGKGVMTPVKNQGPCGSCWAFSTTESIESHLAIATGESPKILSPQNVVSCTLNPDHCGGTGGCQGATAELGFGYVADKGIALEKDYPYTAKSGTCDESKPKVAKLKGFVRLGENNYTDLMAAVANIGPVSISVDASTWSSYSSGIFDGCNQKQPDIDHAVQLVGYGTTDKGSDYWIVRNSWGKTWGESGYIRLARHSDGDMSKWCGVDKTPADGSGCTGGPPQVTVCGTCGIWYDNCYPTGAHNI